MQLPLVRHTLVLWLTLCGSSAIALDNASLELGTAISWEVPAYIDPLEGLQGTIQLTNPGTGGLVCKYRFPNGATGSVSCEPADKPSQFSFSIPPTQESMLGTLELSIERADGVMFKDAGIRSVPLAFVQEFDVTGNPPVVLPYALGDDTHLIRYIPCCNIFGGAMSAERVPVNPMQSAEGLPEKLASDFVVIEPDDLTTATAGTHMHFRYDPASVSTSSRVMVYKYHWQQKSWQELLSFELDAAAGTVDFHCPEGGVFVLGAKTG